MAGRGKEFAGSDRQCPLRMDECPLHADQVRGCLDPEARKEMSRAFFRQARADWELYRFLSGSGKPVCFSLQFLQMASEKLAKAHRFRNGTGERSLLTQHVGLVKFANDFCRNIYSKYPHNNPERLKSIQREIEKVAIMVERLAPAVDRKKTPTNVEYPWGEPGQVQAPVDYEFTQILQTLESPSGRKFVKLIEEAFRDYENIDKNIILKIY